MGGGPVHIEGGGVALVVAGLGSLGSSLLAGVEAARQNLAHPFGSLVEAGGAGRFGNARPLRELAPLASLHDLRLGAFELREDDAHRAAVRAGLLPRALLEELRPVLRSVQAMAGARHAPSRLHLAEDLAGDLRGFAAHHGCARGVLVCTVPGPRTAPLRTLRTADDLWRALSEWPDEVTPGLVYAAAAIQAGYAFVAAAHDASLSAPGLERAFAQAGLPFAGCGLLGPEAGLREALERMAAAEGLTVSGSTSMGTRGTRSGPLGAWERAQELVLSPSWGGGSLELSFELRGPLSLHLAARACDAVLLADLAARAGAAGGQAWMGALFAAPVASPLPAGRREAAASPGQLRENLLAALPALAQAALARATAAA